MKAAVIAGAVVAAIGLAGCTSSVSPDASSPPASSTVSLGSIAHRGYKSFPVSAHLIFTTSADRGPVGTLVRVRMTGCYDPDHSPEYVSLIDDSANRLDTTERSHDVALATDDWSTFTGQIRIPADAVSIAVFRAQCGGSSRTIRFRTTNPVANTACRATDVAVSLASHGGAAAVDYLVPLRFTNVGRTTCWLRGFPEQVRLVEPDGAMVAAKPDGQTQPFAMPMKPGGRTIVLMETEGACAAYPAGAPEATAYGTLEVLIGSTWVSVPGQRRGWDIACGLHYGNYSNAY